MEPENNIAMDENQWLEGLRILAETHIQTPPEEWWGDVARRMNDKAAAAKRRRRMLLGGIGTAAAATLAALFVLLGGGDLENTPGGITAPTIAQEYTEPATGPDMLPEPIREPIRESKPATIAPLRSRPEVEAEQAATPEPVEPTEPMAETGPTIPPQAGKPSTGPEPNTGTPATDEPKKITPRDPIPALFDPPDRKSKRRRWQAGLYAANIPSANNPKGNSEMPNDPGGIFTDPDAPSSYADITHRPPLTVGLTASWGIGGRWSLDAGLNYTMLSSRFRTAGGADHIVRDQVLHNIGIPLGINYALWQGRRLSIYLSAGGAVEKSVSGTATLRHIVGGATQTEQRTSISDKFQWSLRGAAGLQYDFTGTIGIYAEPGVNYYFDNRSGIETVYKTKPLNFGFRLGFRLSM